MTKNNIETTKLKIHFFLNKHPHLFVHRSYNIKEEGTVLMFKKKNSRYSGILWWQPRKQKPKMFNVEDMWG